MRKPRLGTVLLTLWGLLLTAFVCAYLAWLQPSRLSGTVSYVLESSLGMHCDMGRISLKLFPLPTVTIDDLSIRRGSVDHMEFHARRASIQASWFSLLRFKPIVRAISLDSPTLDISGGIVRSALHAEADSAAPLASFSVPDIPRYVTGLRMDIINGACRFTSADGKDSLTITGIDLRARIPSLIPGMADLSVASLRYRLGSGLDFAALDTRIRLNSLFKDLGGEWDAEAQIHTALQLDSLDRVMGRRISDPYRYFPMPEPLRLSLDGSFSATPEQGLYSGEGKTALRTVLPMNGHDVSISLDVPFRMDALDSGIAVTDADVRMGDDRMVITGRIDGLTQGMPALRGKADLHHFSLTRWFGFGRLMDPGLQHALDNITGVFHDFTLTPTGVVVPKLTAYVEGIELHGSGSCTEFLKPVVRIDAHAKTADLNRVFTELHGEFPDLSHLPPPVLPITPSSRTAPPAPNSITVGYDIHISADDAKIMGFRVGGADVHVIPAPVYGTMLAIDVSDVYGGKAKSSVYLQDRIRVVADLKSVALNGPSAALAGYPVLTGKLKEGTVDISFEGGNGARMLTTLGGTVNATMSGGAIKVKGAAPLEYRDFLVKANASASSGRNAKTMPPTVDFTGSWNVTLDAEKWAVHADTPKAALAFSTKFGLPCRIREQSIPLELTLKKALCSRFTQDILLKIRGLSSFDAENGTLSLKDGHVEHADFQLAGSADFRDIFKSPAVSGKVSLKSRDTKKAAALFGAELPAPTGSSLFGRGETKADLFVNSQKLELDALSGKLDAIAFSGRLAFDWASRFRIDGSLSTPSVDLDVYLPKAGDSAPAAPSRTPLPLTFLKESDVRLDLSAKKLRVFSTSLYDVSLPVTQKNGSLTIPLRTRLPGSGTAAGHFSAALSDDGSYANIALQARASQMDMLALSRDRGQKTLLSGLGNADVSLLTAQHCWEDWRRTLDGYFSFFVSNGAIISPQTVQVEGRAAQSRTNFNSLSLSGTAHNGIVSCKDFRIAGNMLSVIGGGTVDLPKETIDAKASITVAGIPEMPVTLSGSLYAPETNYELLGAVTGTVGNLGATLIDLAGSILTAPLKILTGGRSLF